MIQVFPQNFTKRTSQNEDQTSYNKTKEKMLIGQNHLQKYNVVKMMSSGDYICNDQLGNNYLLVCQNSQGGYNQFKASLKQNFVRNSKNRALITPFQDIEHGGLKFAVYMLPEKSNSFSEIMQSKSNSQIFCLSLIYTITNKVVKPLFQLFNYNTEKWLHIQNIWLKESTIYYILNQRKKQSRSSSIKKTQQQNFQQQNQKQKYQKAILRKLCIILVPHFKINLQQKSFLSLVIEALLNQELNIQQLCFLLNDRKKRKSFMDEKTEEDKQINQNNLFFIAHKNNDLWKKRKLYAPDSNNRRELRNQTLNIQGLDKRRNTANYQNQMKRVGETISIPPSLQSRKASLNPHRMFDLKSIAKKRNSLSNSKRFSRSVRENTISVSENVQQMYKTGFKNSSLDKNYTVNVKVQQKAYRRFRQQIQNSPARYDKIVIQQQDKKLRAYLMSRSQQKSRRSSTIQIGDLKNLRFRIHQHHGQNASYIQNNNQDIKKSNHNDEIRQSQQNNFKNNLQKLQYQLKQNQFNKNQKQDQQKNYREYILNLEKQRLQLQKQKQLQRQKQLYRIKQQQKQIQQKQKQRQRQIQKQRQMQKQKQRQRQKQKQKQRQLQLQKERQKQRQLQKQKQKLNILNKQQKDQQNLINETKADNQKIKNKPDIARNSSAQQIKNKTILDPQHLNLDQIQIVQPKLKKQLEDKKKQLEEKQRIQKMNKPPLPKQNELKKSSIEQSQIQQIVLIKNIEKNTKVDEQKKLNYGGSALKRIQEKDQLQQIKNHVKKQDTDSQQRTKTVTSEIASSCGPKKPVSKQVAQYMHMINKMGEGVAKSSRISAKLQGVDWFTGIYFIYKRFLFQRKNIQKWLASKEPKLTRYSQKNKAQWNQWFNSQQKKSLQQKVRLQNENIVSSIIKMNKKIMKKQLPGNFLHHASLSRHSQQQSKIAVSQVVKQYDLLDEKQKLQDDQILTHINQLMSALYIIAELDGKIKQRKPLIQILKKKSQDQLSQFSDYIYELYIKE